MASVHTTPAGQQSVIQYIRSLLEALPRLHALVMELNTWNRRQFAPRREFDARTGQVSGQLLAAAITFIQLVTSLRIMRRVMLHHCKTYSIAPGDCPTTRLADTMLDSGAGSTYRHALEVAAAHNPHDYRPGYAQALLLEDEGDMPRAANEYRAIASLPLPGAYSLLRAGIYAEEQEAIAVYRKAIRLYPDFARAQRALADAMRHSDPLTAAKHYSDALPHSPRLEYGGQSWAMSGHVRIEVEVYQGFRIYFSPEARRHIGFPILLGLSAGKVEGRTLKFWRRFVGLILLRLHKDKAWKRFRGPRQELRPHAADGATETTPARGLVGAAGKTAVTWLVQRLWYCLDPLARWVIRHLHYFRFSLVGQDLHDVKAQIDLIYAKWMYDGVSE